MMQLSSASARVCLILLGATSALVVQREQQVSPEESNSSGLHGDNQKITATNSNETVELSEDPFDIIVFERGGRDRRKRHIKREKGLQYINDAIVNGCGRVIKDGSPVADDQYYGCAYGRMKYCKKTPVAGQEERHVDTVVSLTQVWPDAFYHFLVESLTRVSSILKFNRTLVDTAYFHVGTNKGFGKQWAEMVGIDPERLVAGHVHANVVVVPESNGCGAENGGTRKEFVGETREILRKYIQNGQTNISKTSARKAVLVKRTKNRVVANHDSVLSTLTSSGYLVEESIQHEEGSARDQCALFSQADLIVGPHGAAFSNLLCAKAGTSVIEFQENPHNPCFEDLCEKLDLHYIGLPSKMGHYGNADLPIDVLREELGKIEHL